MSSNNENERGNLVDTFLDLRAEEIKSKIRSKQEQLKHLRMSLVDVLNEHKSDDQESLTYEFLGERERVYDEILKIDDLLTNPQKSNSKYEQLKNIIEMLKKTIEALQSQNDSQKRIIDLLSDELRKKNG